MVSLRILLIYLIPVFVGSLMVHLTWNRNDPKLLLLKLALGIGIGIGATSLLYFLFLLTGQSWFLIWLLGILLLLGMISLLRREPFVSFKEPRLTRLQQILLLVLALIAILDIASFISISLRRPHGAWDSWAVWNRAARFIYRGGDDWQRVYSAEFHWLFHADYPLLVPLTSTWVWDVLNFETTRVPMIQSGIYLFGSAFLLFSALSVFRSIGTASLATIVLMGLPDFVGIGSNQLADTPLALFIAATAILFCLYSKFQQPQLLALAGMTTAFAAWTKNEGMIFLVSSLIGLFVISYESKQAWRLATWYFGGLTLPLLIVLFFRFRLAPSGDLFDAGFVEIWGRMTDFSRYTLTLKTFSGEFFNFHRWGYNAPSFLLYYLAFRQKENTIWSRGLLAVLVMLVIQLLAYFAVYIITPHDLEWHLAFSLDRILLHIYPAALFLLFSVTVAPESILFPQKGATSFAIDTR